MRRRRLALFCLVAAGTISQVGADVDAAWVANNDTQLDRGISRRFWR